MKPKKDNSPTKTQLAQKLRSAASALDHGRLVTAGTKVAQVHRELNAPATPLSGLNNEVRGAWGEMGVAAGNPDHDETDIESSVSDTLANIMHFCKREGIDFEARMETATMHFEEESEEES